MTSGRSVWEVVANRRRELVAAVVGVQLIVLGALSIVQWSRGALTYDFGLYGQAAWLITHGQLDPIISLNGLHFSQNNAEFLFWLVAWLTAPLGGSPFALLLIQDVALVAAGAVALGWVGDIAERHIPDPVARGRMLALGAVAIVANPWCFEAAMFDFHTEVIAGLATVLAARALWNGRHVLFVFSSALVILSGTAGALEGIGLGVAALVVARGRARVGLLVSGVSLGVLGMLVGLSLVGQGGGALSGSVGFGYILATHGGIVAHVLHAAMSIPTALALVLHRAGTALCFLAPVGLIGAASGLAAPIVLAVFVPAMLAHSPIFFRTVAAFQVWPALLVVLAMSVEKLCQYHSRATRQGEQRARGRQMRVRLWALIGSWSLACSVVSSSVLTSLGSTWLRVSPATAGELALSRQRAGGDAEVIASQGVIGRFSARRELFAIMAARHTYPVRARSVVFVLAPRAGVLEISSAATESIVGSLVRLRGPLSEVSAHGVITAIWSPPAGVRSITLPVPTSAGRRAR